MPATFVHDRIPTGTLYLGSTGGISRTREGALVSWFLGNLAPGDHGLVRLVIGVPMRMQGEAVILNRTWITSPNAIGPVYSTALTTVTVPTAEPTETATRRPGQQWTLYLPVVVRNARAGVRATATPTERATPTPRLTGTPAATRTATRTVTPTASRTALQTATPTPSRTASRTPTRTGTPGPTPTPHVVSIMYDDGSAESSQSWEVGKGFALRVNRPSRPAHIVGVGFFLQNPAPIEVHIWDDTGADLITPVVASPTRDGDVIVDLSPLGLVIRDSAFYAGFIHTVDYRPDIQVDLNHPYQMSYEADGGYFEKKTNLNYMIRVQLWYE